MALDATTTADEAYRAIVDVSRAIKSQADIAVAELATDTPADKIFTLKSLRSKYDVLVDYETTPGLVEYAQVVKDDPLYDISAEITALKSSLAAVSTWLDANYPTDVNDYILDRKFNFTTMTWTYRVFTVAQTAGLSSLLSTVSSNVVT